MLFSSHVYAQASGSIGGTTYGHGRSGMFTRTRSTPVNPNSERQRTVRHAMAVLMPQWGQTLTQNQRDAWDLYGSNITWKNVLGQTIFLTGLQHFLRCNVPRIQAAVTIVLDAPQVYDLGTFTAPTFTTANDESQCGVTFTQTDDWASTAGGYCLVYAGKNVSPGRKFYRNPWRFSGRIVGDDPAPFSPALIISKWPWNTGNLCWIRLRIIQPDGRISMPITLGPRTIVPE